jgi:opacity protein-like surface antigen
MTKRSFVAAAVLTSCIASSAMAADMPTKAPPRVTPFYNDWAGFYIGIHGGYGWSGLNGDATFHAEFFGFPDPKPRGGLVGGHAGYLWQWGSAVGGFEIDYSAASLKQDQSIVDVDNAAFTDTRSSKIDALGSARARLGWLWTPNLLAYGTAGIGLAHSKVLDGSLTVSSFESETSTVTSFGWVVGAGLEYQFANNWRLRAEYLHYDFGTVSYFGEVNADLRIDVVRGALSYKF